MKILMVLENAKNYSEQFIWNEIEFLDKNDIELTVLSNYVDGDHGRKTNAKIIQFSYVPIHFFKRLLTSLSVFIYILRYPKLLKLFFKSKRSIKEKVITILKLNGKIHLFNTVYDIIHVQFSSELYEIVDLVDVNILKAKKIVCSLRGHDISNFKLVDKLHRFLNTTTHKIVFFSVCELFSKEIEQMGVPKNRSFVKYSPVNIENVLSFRKEKKYRFKQKKLSIISCGRLVPNKGFDVTIKAISIVLKEMDTTLDIVGYGPEEKNLKKLVKELGLSNHVFFHGRKTQNELFEMLSKSDIFILSSFRDKDGMREGIPNVIKEAMLLKIPVIASRHSGIPELVIHEKTGFLFDEQDYKALSNEVLKIPLLDQYEIENLLETAENLVLQNFDMFKLGYSQLKLYKNIILEL